MPSTLTIESLFAPGDAAPGEIRCVTHLGEGPITWRLPPDCNPGAQAGGRQMARHVSEPQAHASFWIPAGSPAVARDAHGRLLRVSPKAPVVPNAPCPQGVWQLNRRWAESRRKP